jgi:hypothetical protein
MRILLLFLVLATTACSRKVVVTTPAAPTQGPSLKVTNNASQAVTVYAQVAGGTETLVGTVPANSTQVLTVQGITVGTAVKLRAALADGSRSYTRDGVTLIAGYEWRVP